MINSLNSTGTAARATAAMMIVKRRKKKKGSWVFFFFLFAFPSSILSFFLSFFTTLAFVSSIIIQALCSSQWDVFSLSSFVPRLVPTLLKHPHKNSRGTNRRRFHSFLLILTFQTVFRERKDRQAIRIEDFILNELRDQTIFRLPGSVNGQQFISQFFPRWFSFGFRFFVLVQKCDVSSMRIEQKTIFFF